METGRTSVVSTRVLALIIVAILAGAFVLLCLLCQGVRRFVRWRRARRRRQREMDAEISGGVVEEESERLCLEGTWLASCGLVGGRVRRTKLCLWDDFEARVSLGEGMCFYWLDSMFDH